MSIPVYHYYCVMLSNAYKTNELIYKKIISGGMDRDVKIRERNGLDLSLVPCYLTSYDWLHLVVRKNITVTCKVTVTVK